MTSKNYVAIAEILKELSKRGDLDQRTLGFVVGRLSTYFSEDNKRFDHSRFIEATEVDMNA